MLRYSDDLIQEIFAENDIVDYVSQYVQLKKSGRDYSGLCPFHKEKSPSFHVSQDKQLFHCFGCGASGNLVQFVMRTENLDFIEALKLLADRAGIVLPENSNTIDDKRHAAKKRIYEMNRVSARFYYHILTGSPEGKKALAYFAQRKITPQTVIAYGLGYAPDRYDALLEHLRKAGYTDEQITEAGLAVSKEGRIYDRFRGRVMFPILDLRGNVIGFGGRILGEAVEQNGYKPPKYLNSAETPAFSKGNNLFSLNLAKNAKAERMILVEGYMDVITVYQAGIANIVATLGTALTENQAKLLMKYCGEILVCYDSDEAGQKATLRAIDIINGVGGKARVIKLKGAKDPDEYIKKNGIAMFRQTVENAVPSTEFKLSLVKIKYDLSDTDGKVRFVGDAAQALIGIKDAVEVDAYIKRIADETQISKEAIYSEYKKRTARTVRGEPKKLSYREQSSVTPIADTEVRPFASHGQAIAEKKLLNLILQSKKLCMQTQKHMPWEDYSTAVYRQLAKNIYDSWENGVQPSAALITSGFDGAEANEAASVFYNMEIYEDDGKTVEELIKNIKLTKLREQIKQEKDPMKIRELLQMQTELGRNE